VAAALLDAKRFTILDERKDYGEDRWLTFGEIEGRLFSMA